MGSVLAGLYGLHWVAYACAPGETNDNLHKGQSFLKKVELVFKIVLKPASYEQ